MSNRISWKKYSFTHFCDSSRLSVIQFKIIFSHSHWGRERWRARVQVPPLARQRPGHPGGGVSVHGHGCRAQRPALLLPVYPHGGHRPPQTRLHHLPPLTAASPQGSLSYQLVSGVCIRQVRWGWGVDRNHPLLDHSPTTQDPDPWWPKSRVHSVLGWWWTGHWTNPAAEGVWCWR